MSRRRITHLALVAVALAALVAAATGFGSAKAGSKPMVTTDAAGACRAPRGATVRVTMDVEGQGRRSALLHLPRARGGRLPLLVALHGAYGNGAFMERYSGLSRVADRQGFAVIYPDAAGPRWRITAAEGDADVVFLDRLLDRLAADGCVDEDRVSVVGVSNGGGMAARFACVADDRLAGLVTVAGSYGSLPRCAARRPLSVLEIHGTADAVVPYHGDRQNPATDVLAWVRGWASRDGCGASARRASVNARVLRLDWRPCRDGATVEHLRLSGGTHAWPGADPQDPGPDLGVSASEQAWSFLRSARRAPPERHDG